MNQRWLLSVSLLWFAGLSALQAQELEGPVRLPAIAEAPADPPAESPPAETLPTPTPKADPPKADAPAETKERKVVPPLDGAAAALHVGNLLGDNEFFAQYWKPWDGSVELGLSGTDGNSETFNIRLGAKAKHTTDLLVRTLEGVYIDKTANGKSTAHTGLLDGRLERPMPGSPWNFFMHSLLEYDEFKAFKQRFSADTGFGYEFIQTDFTTLITRAGIATSREVGGPDNRFNPELTFGVEFKHKFDAKNTLSFRSDIFPTVTDFSDYRLNSVGSWELVLSDAWGLSLKMSVIDRYDSTPHTAKPNDLDYSTLLIWAF